MTDDEVRTVQGRVDSYLSSKDGRSLDVGNPSHLTLLVQDARSGLANVAEDDLHLVVATCWLGPPSTGIPPATLRQDLLDMLRQCVPDESARLGRVMEFVIAYGCGKWRQVKAGSGKWEQRWQGAMRGLVRALEPAVEQANRWLADHVVGFPQERSVARAEGFPEDTAVWSDAWMLATRFVRPEHSLLLPEGDTLTVECTPEGTEINTSAQDYQAIAPPGAKAVWTVQDKDGTLLLACGRPLALAADATVLLIARDEDTLVKTAVGTSGQQVRLRVGESASIEGPATLALWECTCGTTHCRERHRLEAWDPTRVVQKTSIEEQQPKADVPLTLWDCVASAVKGPQASIKTGAFVQGVYFPLLAQEGFAS
jgi:hypothetical protein